MKKYYILLMAMAIAFFSVSCGDNDDDNGNNTPDGKPLGFDDLGFLQSNLVLVNEGGEFVQRINGATLVSGDTTTVYIGRDDLAHAESTFISWLSPTTVVNETKEGLSADLTDGEGNPQGTVFFREAMAGDTFQNGRVLAVVTFSPETDIKHIEKVVFLPHKLWPLAKKESPYYVGDITKEKTYDEGDRDWLCVREAKEGECGLLVYLSQRKSLWNSGVINNFASPNNAKAVSAAIRPQFEAFKQFFSAAGMTLNTDYYWINDWHSFLPGIYSIRFSDGDIDWWNTSFKNPSWRYVQVKTFTQQE